MRNIIFFIFLLISCQTSAQQGGVFQYLKILPTTIPSYCSVGDLRTNTSTDTLNFCTASNNWAAFQGLLTWTSPLVNTGGTISIPEATSTQNGYLGSTDWTTFNGKQNSITFGTTTESTSDVLSLSGWTNATQGSPTIQVKKANTTQDGYLSSTDWTTFNNKQATISVTAPIGLSGTTISANIPWAITTPNSTTTGEIIKGASSQSNDLVDWENSTGTILSEINSSGKIGVGTTIPNSMVQINAISSTTVGEIVQGASSQSSDLVDWKNNNGTVLSEINSSGNLGIGTTSPNGMVQIIPSSSSTVAELIQAAGSQTSDLLDFKNSTGTILTEVTSGGTVGIGISAPTATLQVNTAAAVKGVIVKGASGQSSDLQDWQNSTGTVLFGVGSGGVLSLSTGAGSSGQFLESQGSSTAPIWGTALSNPMTTAGDIIYSSSGSTPARLGIGTGGSVLTVSTGTTLPIWSTPSAAPTNNYAQAYFGSASSWASNSTSFADPTNSGGNSLTVRQHSGITLTAESSSGNHLPGIVFTPTLSTSIYLITAVIYFETSAVSNYLNMRLTDGTTTITENGGVNGGNISADAGTQTLTGIYVPGTASSVTVKIQLAANAGTGTIVNNSGISTGPTVEWTVIQLK